MTTGYLGGETDLQELKRRQRRGPFLGPGRGCWCTAPSPVKSRPHVRHTDEPPALICTAVVLLSKRSKRSVRDADTRCSAHSTADAVRNIEASGSDHARRRHPSQVASVGKCATRGRKISTPDYMRDLIVPDGGTGWEDEPRKYRGKHCAKCWLKDGVCIAYTHQSVEIKNFLVIPLPANMI